MNARLLVLVDGDPPRELELGLRTTVGRHPSQTLQLLDRMVSKEHAIIERVGEGYAVADLGSRNGTYLNRRLVKDITRLGHGDTITVGNTRLVYFEPTQEVLPGRVTIGSDGLQSSLEHEIPIDVAQKFMPEHQVSSETQLRQDYERLRLAYEMQQGIGTELNLDALLERLMDYVFATLAVERGALLLRGESGELEPRVVRTRGDNTGESIAISHTILDKVVEEKTAVLSSDARFDARFSASESIILQGLRSTMSVPLLAHGRLLGVLHLDNRLAAGAFTDKDLAILQGLAAQAALSIESAYLARRLENLAALRERFERLLSPNLVEKVVSGELSIQKGGQLRRAAVLFADLRDFTKLTAELPPEEVVQLLNEFFEAAVDCVFQLDGTLDKFMGDGFLAVWGAPVQTPSDSLLAVRAALRIQRVVKELNECRAAEGEHPLAVGIGIDTGELVAGYIGSSRTMGYTVVGNTVNRAARLCAVAGPDQVLISEDTFREVQHAVTVQEQPPQTLKGIRKPVRAYEVTSVSLEAPYRPTGT